MSEMEEDGGAFDDWRAMVSSPKPVVSDFASEEFDSKPMSEALSVEKVDHDDDSVLNSDPKLEEGGVSVAGVPMEASSEWKCTGLRSGESIAERRAAKCGFNAARINTARFRSASPLSSPAARSPYLTIPSGISPTALLESPVMLPNSQPPTDFEFPVKFPKEAATRNSATESPPNTKLSENMILNASSLALQSCHANIGGDQMPQYDEEDAGTHNLLEGDQKGTYPPVEMTRNSEDGYNWRKYGQKQVKGSEYPRSYYKCTHPNCQVKKKVERSHDGHITEIIYKSTHNHPKPQPNRRSLLGSPFSFNEITEVGEGNRSCIKVEGGVVWRNIQLGYKDMKVGADWRTNGLKRTSSDLTEISGPLTTTQGKSMGEFVSSGTAELSSTLASHDDNDDDEDDNEYVANQGSISLVDDADDDEIESKRRKKDSCLNETNLVSSSVREPRVVVQIESEVDILEDGYRWRKYGQKVVKGNPNPRSYYKCTSAGCSVRKHVERASQNLKCIVTTYEGKHNHEVPAARNNSHVNSGGGNLPPAAPNTEPTLTVPRNANVPKPETQVQDLSLRFERKPDYGSEFMKPSFLANFGNDSKFGASPIYQMKWPPLHSTIPYGSFVLNPNSGETHLASSVPPVVPDFLMPLPLTIPRFANMSLGGFDFNNNGKAIGPVQSFLGGQQFRENDIRLLKPKQEQKDDNIYDTHFPL